MGYQRRAATFIALVVVGATMVASDLAAQDESITIAREHLALLQQQTREHREFLEFIYTIWTALLGLGVVVVGGLLAFFNVKTKKQVEELVERQIHSSVSQTFRHRLEEITADFQARVNRHGTEIEELNASIRDKVDGVNEELDQALEGSRERMTTIQDDVAALTRAVADLQDKLSIPEGARLAAGEREDARRELIWERMRYALLNHRYVWRSIERLALAGDTSPQQAEEVLREHLDEVVLSRGKSGRTIARHKTRRP